MTLGTIVPILEVIGPAEQGRSIPYLCRGADGSNYYVKAQQTNRAGLWREWICGHLAQAIGLPVAPFNLVQLDPALVRELPREWQALGSLPAFGSCERAPTSWLELGSTYRVSAQLQLDVLVFDWWVRNTDRLRGNTNLLWDTANDALVVIDHNAAFDPDFEAGSFLEHHVFADRWAATVEDWVVRANYAERLTGALPTAQQAIATAPKEWLWENSELDVPARFDPVAALGVLNRCTSPDFWRTV